MLYSVYKYAGEYRFQDERGMVHGYPTERGAKMMATKIKKQVDALLRRAVTELHYDTQEGFGRKVYEDMYMNNAKASKANNNSGSKCVLAWMMHDYSTCTFECRQDLLSLKTNEEFIDEDHPRGYKITDKWDDGYSVKEVLNREGYKLVYFTTGWRVFYGD